VSKKIVLADDEAHIVHVVSMKLRNAGYEVITAMDGEEALELCFSQKPDLLITDNQMPYMTGMELCKQLRQRDANWKIPAIMLTARGYDLDSQEVAEAGIVAVLAKPFSPREILEKVTGLIGAGSPVVPVEQK
jgi:two-component system alkaline phosphatase synthesis response regulator PhoP